MTAKLDYAWKLREVMATRGLFQTTHLRPSPSFLAKLILRMFPQVRICGWRLIAYDLTARCPPCQVEGLV
jgi:hypothetical protein